MSRIRRAEPLTRRVDPSLVELVRKLSPDSPDGEIARILNMKHLTTPRGLRWTQDRVRDFRKQHRIRSAKRGRDTDHLSMNAAQIYLGISHTGFTKKQLAELHPFILEGPVADFVQKQ